MTVEIVTFFRSGDGVLHETEQACLIRNFTLEARPKIKASLTENAMFLKDQPELLDVDAVCNWVIKCTPEILAILTTLVTPIDEPRRRRRTKADIALEKAAQAVLQAQSGNKLSTAMPAQSLNEFAATEAQMLTSVSMGHADFEPNIEH